MATVTPMGAGIPGAEPFNVWSKQETKSSSSSSAHDLSQLDMEELIKIEESSHAVSSEDGGSPTKFSAQTIRPKKGRQLLSSMITNSTTTTTSSQSSSSASPSTSTNTTTSGTGSLPTFPSGSTTMTEKTSTTTTVEKDGTSTSTETESTSTRGFGGGVRGGFPSVGLYQGLGRLQSISALGFATFGFIHLIPPVLGAFGGIDLANKALILGRVYYQTYGLEQVLVFGSFGVHLVTGLCRALIRVTWKAKSYFAARKQGHFSSQQSLESESTTSTSPVTSTRTSSSSGTASTPGAFPWHRLVGWLLTPLVIGHVNGMRFKPLDAFGDSSLVDYSLVTYIHRMGHRPPYILLVGFMVYHMVGGGIAAYNGSLPKGSKSRVSFQDMIKSRKTRAVVAGVVTTVTMVGVYRILTAEGTIPMAKLYSTLGF